MYQINQNFSIMRLNNAEFVAFFLNFQKAITNATATSLGLDDNMSAFDAKLLELTDRVYVSTGSEFTVVMKAADDRRCLIFRRIRLRLQMVEVAEQNTALLACQDVVRTHLLSKYVANVVTRAYQERTSILQGFIYDLQTKLSEDDIEALSLSDDILALEAANNEFIAAYAQRTAEKAEGNTGVTTRLRNEMYDIYLQMIFIIQYLANSTDENNTEKALACQGFIAYVNVLLSDAKKRLDQRLNNEDEESIGEGKDGDVSDESGNSSEVDNGSSYNSGSSGSSGNSDNNDEGGNNEDSSSYGEQSGDDDDPNKPNENGNLNDGELTF